MYAKGDRIPRNGLIEETSPTQVDDDVDGIWDISDDRNESQDIADDMYKFLVWLECSRELSMLREYPSEEIMEYLIDKAKEYVESLDPNRRFLQSEAVDIRKGKFTLRIVFANPLGRDFPTAFRPDNTQVLPYNARVPREPWDIRASDPGLVDWMIRRLRKAVAKRTLPHGLELTQYIDSAGGQLRMPEKDGPAPFGFGYRLLYNKRGWWSSIFSQGTPRVLALGDVENILEDAERTWFGSPILDPRKVPEPLPPAPDQRSGRLGSST